MTNLILEEDCSDLTVYFTIHHSILLYDMKQVKRIHKKYGDRLILQPNLFCVAELLGDSDANKKVQEVARAFLETNPAEWLQLEMRFHQFEAEMRNYPESMYDTANLESIIQIIESNPQYSFYESVLYDNFSQRSMIDGDSEGRLKYIEKAIECAEKHNDIVRIGDFLNKKARIIIDDERTQARELLLQSIQLTKTLGMKADIAYSQDQLSKIEATRGEYNLAINHYEENITILESIGLPSSNTSLILSALYNIIGEPDSGYEWGLMTEAQFKHRPLLLPRAILNQAWSLILMKKTTEALLLIDSVRDTITRSGRETEIAWLHFVSGVLEIADGDYASAMSSIEEALKIYENRAGTLVYQNMFLHYLARIEVHLSDKETNVSPYLSLLEERARSEDLPGILGQALLLQAELAIIQEDDASLRHILIELGPLAETPSMEFLRSRFDHLLTLI